MHSAAPIDLGRPTRARIVATVGPACETPEMIGRLVDAGVSVFRLNFSHGDLASHAARLRTIRRVAADRGRPVGVLGDLCGPKIRLGVLPPGGVRLERGQEIVFDRSAHEGRAEADAGGGVPVAVLPVTYPALVDEAQPGHRVLINDGAVRLLAVEREERAGRLRCRVTVGGLVTSGKGINLPDSDVRAPAITERDWECVHWAVEHGMDFLALSFVRTAAEVQRLKQHLSGVCAVDYSTDKTGTGSQIPVVAKIEKPQAVEALESIVEAADGIMVARGDLGVEMDIAQVPVVQKRVVEMCREWGKPCIVATQMLESMMEGASPTRAEASDIANAVFDGADALMLSGETATGRHPALVVETMRRVIAAAEARQSELPEGARPVRRFVKSGYRTAALAHGARHVAEGIGARLVVCWSQAGGTARYLSGQEFRVPIIAYSSDERATRRMGLLGGVTAVHTTPPRGGLPEWTDAVERELLARGWAKEGDPVLLVAGMPLGMAKATNRLAILHVGDPRGGFRDGVG